MFHCFETGKITTFPKYKFEDKKKKVSQSESSSESWSIPKRYNLRSSQKQENQEKETVPLSNRYTPLTNSKKETHRTSENSAISAKRHQISQVVHNISNVTLNDQEMSLLEKGLNFCPSTNNVNKEEMLDDTFSYCRKLRLKHNFEKSIAEDANQTTEVANQDTSHVDEPSSIHDNDEKCPMKTTYKNPYFNAPSNYTPPNLEKYIAATKSDITKLMSQPSRNSSNLSPSERVTLDSLKNRSDIIITSADKGGKVVIMDKTTYVEN